jgi:mannose-6-phosphate isomerase class I
LSTPYFQIEHIKNEGIKHYEFEKAKWLQVTVVSGSGLFDQQIKIYKGDTFLTSCKFTSFDLTGHVELIITYCC